MRNLVKIIYTQRKMKANKYIHIFRKVNIVGYIFAKMHTSKEQETRN